MSKAIAAISIVCTCIALLLLAGASASACQEKFGVADQSAQQGCSGSDAAGVEHLGCHGHCSASLTMPTAGVDCLSSHSAGRILPVSERAPSGPVAEIEHPPQLI